MNVVPLFAMPPKTDRFDEFWKVYPRKKDKLDAMRAWQKAIKIATPEEIIAGAARYARVAEAPYIKLPATFLNKGSWMDEESQPPAQTDPIQSGLHMKASMVNKAATGNKFCAEWVRNNVTPQDMEELKARGLL